MEQLAQELQTLRTEVTRLQQQQQQSQAVRAPAAAVDADLDDNMEEDEELKRSPTGWAAILGGCRKTRQLMMERSWPASSHPLPFGKIA